MEINTSFTKSSSDGVVVSDIYISIDDFALPGAMWTDFAIAILN
jgi:uncharacterized membrane protein